MEKAIAIETCLGILRFRDCIFLDSVEQDDRGNLTFSGEINGDLTSEKSQQDMRWFPYTLTFQRVLACFSCELDTYENMCGASNPEVALMRFSAFFIHGNMCGAGNLEGSDFDVIENSKWLESLPVRKDFQKDRYKHYRLFTYDIVYNIIAGSYKLEIDTRSDEATK